MNIQEIASECGRSDMTVRRWIKSGLLPAKRKGLREIYIDSVDFDKFCTDNGIVRKGER